MQVQRKQLNFEGQNIYAGIAGQTHLNLLGFSINNHYSIQHQVFSLSHFSFSIVHV
ncbi:hypothetical protein AGMMS50239_08930 [Bacteroidia bacterium]|nr:hypothetical protein AGMMS50239_08930 [Bacteroidia bacterium]